MGTGMKSVVRKPWTGPTHGFVDGMALGAGAFGIRTLSLNYARSLVHPKTSRFAEFMKAEPSLLFGCELTEISFASDGVKASGFVPPSLLSLLAGNTENLLVAFIQKTRGRIASSLVLVDSIGVSGMHGDVLLGNSAFAGKTVTVGLQGIYLIRQMQVDGLGFLLFGHLDGRDRFEFRQAHQAERAGMRESMRALSAQMA